MVLMRILLSPVANGHEFWLNERKIPVSSKNTRFSSSICLIVSQYSTLNFWTLSVAAWLLYHVFFYDLILTSAWADTLPWSSLNFPSDEQIIHTTLPKWHLDALPPVLSRMVRHFSDDLIAVFLSVSAVNYPRYFKDSPVFGLDFY
jgi:hypothetical protein